MWASIVLEDGFFTSSVSLSIGSLSASTSYRVKKHMRESGSLLALCTRYLLQGKHFIRRHRDLQMQVPPNVKAYA